MTAVGRYGPAVGCPLHYYTLELYLLLLSVPCKKNSYKTKLVVVTNNAWKFASWKIIKNSFLLSCCKNNLCEYLVRALIVFPSRSWSFPFIIVLPIWEGDSFLVCTSPSLLWLQLFVRYYACTNQGHNFLVREEFTVCMWELHRKRKTMHDSWCSRTNFHCGNTYTHGKWITYLLWSVFVLLSMQVSW